MASRTFVSAFVLSVVGAAFLLPRGAWAEIRRNPGSETPLPHDKYVRVVSEADSPVIQIHSAILGAPAPIWFMGMRLPPGGPGAASLDKLTPDEAVTTQSIEPIRTPLLILVGADDRLLALDTTLHDRLARAGKQVRMEVYEHGYHDFCLGPQGHTRPDLKHGEALRIDTDTLRQLSGLLDRVGASLLVDEVYLEGEFGERPESCVHAGPNVITTNSLTKAYGLDGLRAGWLLGANGVAPGERMQLAAFARLAVLRSRARGMLEPNLSRVREFLATETRLTAHVPEGGNVVFPRLPAEVDSDRLTDLLRDEYSTLVVPGRFFESPRHIRISFGMPAEILASGLRNITRALDDLTRRRAPLL